MEIPQFDTRKFLGSEEPLTAKAAVEFHLLVVLTGQIIRTHSIVLSSCVERLLERNLHFFLLYVGNEAGHANKR